MADSIWTYVATGTGSVSGTQNITGAPEQPKAAIILCTEDGDSDHAENSIGITDGTNYYALAYSSDDANSGSNSARELNSANVVHCKPRSSTPKRSAAFSSWLSTGIQLDWDPAAEDSDSSSTYKYTVILFGGDSLSVDCDSFTSSATEDNSIDVTAPGFQADLVVVLSGDSNLSSSKGDLKASFGLYDRAAGTNVCYMTHEATGQSTTVPKGVYRTNRAMQAAAGSGSLSGALELSSNANGFTATTRDSNDTMVCSYLAMNFGGDASVYVAALDSPSSTGDDSRTGPGWTPQLLFIHQSSALQSNPASAETGVEYSGFGVTDGSTTTSHGIAIQSGQTTTNTHTHYSSSEIVNDIEGDSTDNYVATFKSFDASGWTLTYSVADTVNLSKFLALAIESIGSTTITGTSAMAMLLPTASSAGQLTYLGTSSMTMLLPTASAAGQLTYLGTSAATMLLPTMSAAGSVTYLGTSAMAMLLPTMSASGTAATVGTSAALMLLPTMSASGQLTYLGTSTLAMLLPTMSAAGVLPISGTSAIAILLPVMVAEGSVPTTVPPPFLCVQTLGRLTTIGSVAAASHERRIPATIASSIGH